MNTEWQLTDEMRQAAELYGLDADEQFWKWQDWCLAKGFQPSHMLAAFRRWCSQARERSENGPMPAPPKKELSEATKQRLHATLLQLERELHGPRLPVPLDWVGYDEQPAHCVFYPVHEKDLVRWGPNVCTRPVCAKNPRLCEIHEQWCGQRYVDALRITLVFP